MDASAPVETAQPSWCVQVQVSACRIQVFAPLCMTDDVCATRLQVQMSQGKSQNQTELYKCVCPPCFFELEEGGRTSCLPKGNLDYCDLPSGVYSNPGTAGGCC